MNRCTIVTALGITALLVAGPAMAGKAADDVTVSGAYARAVPPGQPNSAAFMTLTNGSATDHVLLDAESPVAKVVELHTHLKKDGMMQMRRVDSIDLPAGKETRLQPGGYHVMLIGLKQQLMPEQQVAITLVFKDGSRTTVTAPVKKLQMKMMKQGGGMNMQHGQGGMMMK
ncbi:MAG TPA: copper chaperone PCu(A)C [Sedimenticola thiotaurini]|uniref:Copper chaperone PCu(A)C n=1 Tax=Sedimenticola thiotaurini TaxID=1543721 RepID=A0A831RM41_9GAMM|nr:copper chaperone PCu(A)C [Sedimenticola thiotaurini]